MKKFLLSTALGLGLFAGGVNLSHAQTAFTEDFINNGTYVCVTNQTTNTFIGYTTNVSTFVVGNTTNTVTNYTASANSGAGFWYFNYATGTNVLGLIQTNANTGAPVNGPFVDADLFANENCDVNTNYQLCITVGAAYGYPLPPAVSPVVQNTIWSTPQAMFTNSVLGTNTLILNFAPVVDPLLNTADTSRLFAWTIPLAGQTLPYSTSVTIPPSLVVGASKLRLYSIYCLTNTAVTPANQQGDIIDSLRLKGFKPNH